MREAVLEDTAKLEDSRARGTRPRIMGFVGVSGFERCPLPDGRGSGFSY